MNGEQRTVAEIVTITMSPIRGHLSLSLSLILSNSFWLLFVVVSENFVCSPYSRASLGKSLFVAAN